MLNKTRQIIKNLDVFNKDSLNRAIHELKQSGASQVDTVRLLVTETELNLREADRAVLDSEAWKESKAGTEAFRDKFFNDLEKLPVK